MEEQDDVVTIDFKALFLILLLNKWLIIIITTLIISLGVIYAFTAREEFVSEGKILPELSNGTNGGLGGLAGLAALGGIDIGMSNSGLDAIRPDLYPDIINTTPFYLSLLKKEFQTKEGDSLYFETYFHQIVEKNKIFKEIDLELFKVKPNGVIILNRLTEERIKDLKERIVINYDKKSGVISISTEMPDPVIAAQITFYTMNYLTNYVTDYRTEKLKQEVDFLGRKVASARGVFYKDQARKASYADQFSAPTIRLQSADIQRERLESDYKLSSNVYNELLKKYEEAKIKLQQETPIFQILDPPTATNLKFKPKRILIVIISGILGLFTSISIAIFKSRALILI